MNYFRKLAISAGILFIIYTSVDVLTFLFLGSLTEPNYLVSVSENAGMVGAGAFLLLNRRRMCCWYCNFAISRAKNIQSRSSSWSCWFQDFRGSVAICIRVIFAWHNYIKPVICKSWSS